MRIAVLDIGGTSIKSGMFEDGELRDIREQETKAAEGAASVMERAKGILRQYPGAERIGISTAGQVDFEKGLIRYANSNMPGYTGTQVRSIMEEEFKVPVAVENDVNAAGLGEAHFGAGRGADDFICLTYGTGVGGAIILNGQVYRGSTGSAGEMGAMIIHPRERRAKEDMYSGCYEKYASATALVNRVRAVDDSLDNGRKIFDALHREYVKAEVDGWIMEIVSGLVSLIHIFNPSCVVLGGGVMSQSYVVEQVSKLTRENIMESYRHVKILKAALGNQAGMFGAARLAMDIK